MKLLDVIIEILNEGKGESEPKFERLHSTPVQLVETKTGIVHKDVKTGKFVKKSS